jgi:hypothetical protein
MIYKEILDMPNFQINPIDLPLSANKSKRRIERAVQSFGEGVTRNLLSFALFLLGADRKMIATHLSMPKGTFLSLLTKIGRDGLPALEDRRQKESDFLAHGKVQIPDTKVELNTDEVIITMGNEDTVIRIPARNSLQIKVVLLTLHSNGLLTSSTVAGILNCTTTHCSRLSRQLVTDDVPSLIDKRTGQKDDYRVGPEEKAQIIQQLAVRIISGHKASSEVLAKAVKEQTGTTLSPRTIRDHINKLGLNNIKNTLPELMNTLKKS